MKKIKIVYDLNGNRNVITFNTQSQSLNWHSIMEENYPNSFKVFGVYEPRTLKEKIEWRLRVLKNDIGLKLGKKSIL